MTNFWAYKPSLIILYSFFSTCPLIFEDYLTKIFSSPLIWIQIIQWLCKIVFLYIFAFNYIPVHHCSLSTMRVQFPFILLFAYMEDVIFNVDFNWKQLNFVEVHCLDCICHSQNHAEGAVFHINDTCALVRTIHMWYK